MDLSDAQAAYASEKKANANLQVAISELKKEVAAQHTMITAQNHQLAMMKSTAGGSPNYTASTRVATTPQKPGVSNPQTVALVSYGWGTI